ncbi:uncharacterized protein LOC589903 isoform X2 [Strongylocentrotus purpuratus]|uniref:HYR domain-containing protein n=1 Tax=Strongylocentrotus purpuratus TaxID=7668 RepID=A0A7M7STW6_STRPU|nr:uncharacterized protein LOC589903 isoform X2 [Strongylocentrotus purpuratus]
MSGHRSRGTLAIAMVVLLIALNLKECNSEDTCAFDMDPPNVTCSNVTTKPFLPNSFLGLVAGTEFTNVDENVDPSGATYNVTKGRDGDLFLPGHTPVTLFVKDICQNVATCLFYVENTLTELPVNCPDLNRNVSTDVDKATYTFNPDFGADDVTKSASGYRYHGGGVSVNLTLGGSPLGSSVSIGTHDVVALIYDDVLNKTCTGIYIITDNVNPVVACPADFTSDTLTVSFSADVTDNVDPAPALTYDPVGPGSVFPLGPTTVTVTATDSSSNKHSCSFTVTVTVTSCF